MATGGPAEIRHDQRLRDRARLCVPFFAWLNLSLVSANRNLSGGLRALAYAGLVFLAGFTALFLANLTGLLG